jgi:hypothetical protein
MASNVTAILNAYQINQDVMVRDAPKKFAFPTQGCLLQDCSTSPTRSLSSGYNVYSLIIIPSSAAANSFGTEYYVAETLAQLVTIFNA